MMLSACILRDPTRSLNDYVAILREASMPARPHTKAQAQKPTFVFKGTIKKLKASMLKELPVSNRTAIVTIDQIIEAPPDLARYNGQEITVLLSGRRKVVVGRQMTFHTVSWLYGESIAVRSLDEEPIKAREAATLSVGAEPFLRVGEREKLEHFNDADLVLSGRVVA